MTKISAYSLLSSARSDDVLPIVDVHDTTMASTGTTKRVNVAALRQIFWINDYGADPTGVTLSDSAFTAALAAAQAAVQAPAGTAATSGAMVGLGKGVYTFSVGVVANTDARIGLIGPGKASCLLRTTGNTGILVSWRGGSEPGTPGAAPVGGFSLYGWDAGNNVTGIRFGDRQYGTMHDIYCNGFNGTGSIAFQIAGTGNAVAEGVDGWGLVAKTCNIAFSVDGTLGGTSADYSRWKLHAIDNNVALQFINGGHAAGSQWQLTGTAGSANWANPTVLVMGNGGTDGALLLDAFLQVGMECTTGSTTVKDIVINTSASGGIQNCSGHLMFLQSSGTFAAGSITGGRFSFTGNINGSPLLGLTGTQDMHRQDLSQAIGYFTDSAQALSNGSTIHTATDGRYGVIPITETGAVTGIILEPPAAINLPGSSSGLVIKVVNRSAFSVTFAASGTSHVADGASDVIAALSAASYTYDSGTSLWYRG